VITLLFLTVVFIVGFFLLRLLPTRQTDMVFLFFGSRLATCVIFGFGTVLCLVAAYVLLESNGSTIGCPGRACKGLSSPQMMWVAVAVLVLLSDLLAAGAIRVLRTRNDPERGARWGDPG
jgi:hypothetical protein